MRTIVINSKDYSLFGRNEDRNNVHPHMIDMETGEVPCGQRGLLKEFLTQNNVDVEPWDKKNTHWAVIEAIKLINPKAIDFEVKEEIQNDSEYLEITIDNIEEQERKVIESNNYGKEQQIIESVIKNYKGHDDINIVAMKISVIDVTNSTQLAHYKSKISLYDLATIIMNISEIDNKIKDGNPDVVNEIAKVCKNEFNVNLFSFASKYCHYHNRFLYGKDDYSIYDSVVKETLPHYFDIKKQTIENWRTTIDYKSYNNFIGNVLDSKNIHIPNRRTKFDHFLWYANRTK